MSRTICVAALGLGLLVAAGCGSKPEPPPIDAKLEPTAPEPKTDTPQPKTDTPAARAAPALAYEADPAKHVIPDAPLRGRIAGTDVIPVVVLEGSELTLCTYKTDTPKNESPVVERSVKLKLTPMLVYGQVPPNVFGRKWTIRADDPPGGDVPQVWRAAVGKVTQMYPPGCAVTLEFGALKGGKVPGKIYLCLRDDDTVLAGTFEATYFRSAVEPPGPNDVPYIGGTVTLTDPKKGAESVRLGYTPFPPTGALFPESELPFVLPPAADQPAIRVGASTLVPGDGVGRLFRYEHVKLAPGRYLLTAALPDGPTVWRWVDVATDTGRTENIVLGGTVAGQIEVSVPADTVGTVFAVPSDDPSRPPIDANAFQRLAFQITRQGVDVAAGKAVLKNLAPGKYEVRVGDLRGFVDVTSGKTAELTLTPPKK